MKKWRNEKLGSEGDRGNEKITNGNAENNGRFERRNADRERERGVEIWRRKRR